MGLRSNKIKYLKGIPLYVTTAMLLVVVIVIVMRFSSVGNSIMGLVKNGSDPESVIPPVQTEYESDPSNYFNRQSLVNLRAFQRLVYNWPTIFDIFVSNPQNRNPRYQLNSPSLENITKDVRDPSKFYKGSSEEILADYGNIIKEECKYYKLDWRLVLGIIKQESAFMPEAESHAGAYGFMQIMPRTGETLEQTLNLEEHRSPINNLKAGIYYYALLVARYNDCGDTNKYCFALAAYNAGSGHVEDAMSIAYYFHRNYLDWEEVKEDMKLLAPANDSLHREIWGSRPPNGVFANWKEPYNYVENIMYYWEQYKKIYPIPEDNQRTVRKKKKK